MWVVKKGPRFSNASLLIPANLRVHSLNYGRTPGLNSVWARRHDAVLQRFVHTVLFDQRMLLLFSMCPV
jgi:hypothetical protein